eukprot:03330.XXX_141020_141157_1 [CDS] Oithona nana genome sequencing.
MKICVPCANKQNLLLAQESVDCTERFKSFWSCKLSSLRLSFFFNN